MEVDLHVLDPPDSSSPTSSPSLSSPGSSDSSLFSGTDPTGPEEWDPKYPPIHFTGSSRGVHSGTSKIRGTVRMMREGVVRWNFVSTVQLSSLTFIPPSPLASARFPPHAPSVLLRLPPFVRALF